MCAYVCMNVFMMSVYAKSLIAHRTKIYSKDTKSSTYKANVHVLSLSLHNHTHNKDLH